MHSFEFTGETKVNFHGGNPKNRVWKIEGWPAE